MNPSFNPDSWMDLAAYLIIGLPALVAAVATFVVQKRQRDTSEKTLYEVKNEHATNLRDDIDDLADAVRDGFSEMHHEMGILREELRHERVERVEGDRRRLL